MGNNRDHYQKQEYISRINKVIDYINENLEEEFSLNKLASVASFSPYHFHRIFGSIIGETLNQFITRLRLEKAAWLLLDRPKDTITEIAFTCGFSGSSTFARAFKDKFGMSASDWRDGGYKRHSKIRKIISNNRKHLSNSSKTNSNDCEDYLRPSVYISGVFSDHYQQFKWRVKLKNSQNIETTVEVKDLPDMEIAYVRHIGPYKGDGALFERLFTKLCNWAGPRGLINPPESIFLTVYYDNPDITDDDKLRLDVAITVPKDTKVDGDIGKTRIKGGKYAMARFRINEDQYEEAWKTAYGGWLPESGYQPDDKPCMEIFRNDPKSDPEGKHEFDICIPVKPL